MARGEAAASQAIVAAGGTITHHHAVGRDRPWYGRQRPDPFALQAAGAKAAVDSAGTLNRGVLRG